MAEKRIPWAAPQLPAFQPAGGTASATDVMGAAFDQMMMVDNTTAANDALTEAYENLRRDIRTSTGVDLGNPMIVAPEPSLIPNPIASIQRQYGGGDQIAEQRLAFQQKMNELAANYPREAIRDWFDRDPARDAEALARQADEQLGRVMASRPGWDSYVYQFAGGAAAALRDPVTIGSLFLGGGPGGARTALGRIMATAGREAAVNAGTEAAMQPWVQDWRNRAGLDSGIDQALMNVAMAAGLGGVLGAAGRGVVEGVNFARMTPEQRARLQPQVRGAIDAADTLAMVDAKRPAEFSAARHEELLAKAEAAMRARELPALVLDDGQVSRILETLAPDRVDGTAPAPADMAGRLEAIRNPQAAAAAPRPVTSFVASIGGVDPDGPMGAELRAIGLTSRDMPGLFRRGGRAELDNIPIDEARDAFGGRTDIEDGNGYVNRQAFIDALQAEQGARQTAAPDTGAERAFWERRGIDFETMDDAEILRRMAAASDVDARWEAAGPEYRTRAETAVRAAIEQAGGTAPDAAVRAAVDLHLREGEDLQTAMDWAMSDLAGVSRALPEASDIAPPAPERGIDDPAGFEAADLDWQADLTALEEFDPELAAQLRSGFGSTIDSQAAIEKVVKACPF